NYCRPRTPRVDVTASELTALEHGSAPRGATPREGVDDELSRQGEAPNELLEHRLRLLPGMRGLVVFAGLILDVVGAPQREPRLAGAKGPAVAVLVDEQRLPTLAQPFVRVALHRPSRPEVGDHPPVMQMLAQPLHYLGQIDHSCHYDAPAVGLQNALGELSQRRVVRQVLLKIGWIGDHRVD